LLGEENPSEEAIREATNKNWDAGKRQLQTAHHAFRPLIRSNADGQASQYPTPVKSSLTRRA